MKKLFGVVLVAVPVAMELTGNGAAGMVTLAAGVGGLCWLVSGWFSE